MRKKNREQQVHQNKVAILLFSMLVMFLITEVV